MSFSPGFMTANESEETKRMTTRATAILAGVFMPTSLAVLRGYCKTEEEGLACWLALPPGEELSHLGS